ncbi:MAG: DUF2254 domain-containing protein [Candidatus Binatia bacterium]
MTRRQMSRQSHRRTESDDTLDEPRLSSTLIALSVASSQYSSRVLRNFMSDRGTQSVLGAFVGIFAYCLVVLRTIRGGDEGAFVPSLAVLGGLLLGLVGIAVFIYFIHHISLSIQASHILAAVSAETLQTVGQLYPRDPGGEGAAPEPVQTGAVQAWHPVAAAETGYVQSLDTKDLLAFASERGTVVRMEARVGQFVVEGLPLAFLRGTPPTDDDSRRLTGLYTVGRQRTAKEDATFGIRQLVDVALKALSPGINDTTTAVMCIDHLTAILVCLADRRIDSRYRSADGAVRLLTCGPTYADFIDESFDQIRQNAAGNVAVLDSLLGSLERLASETTRPSRRPVLLEHALAVSELVRRSVPAARDRQRLDVRSARVLAVLRREATVESGGEPDPEYPRVA